MDEAVWTGRSEVHCRLAFSIKSPVALVIAQGTSRPGGHDEKVTFDGLVMITFVAQKAALCASFHSRDEFRPNQCTIPDTYLDNRGSET
jgi:hypothetical protein